MEVTVDKTILQATAHQKLLTSKPLINLSANKIRKALMATRNNPNVKMVAGSVKMTMTGFKTELKKASTKAVRKAMAILLFSIVTPGRNMAVNRIANVDKQIFNRKFMLQI
jgi:hypothetical protein